jgi:hypothetical protein
MFFQYKQQRSCAVWRELFERKRKEKGKDEVIGPYMLS